MNRRGMAEVSVVSIEKERYARPHYERVDALADMW